MKNKKIIMTLTALIVVLSLAAALIGVLSNQEKKSTDIISVYGEEITLYQQGLYAHDSVSMATQARAQDLITLIIGIPLLIVGLCMTKQESIRGLYLLTGTIGYFLYTYTSYACLTMYNPLFLLYVLLMTLSFYDFVLCMMSLHKTDVEKIVAKTYPIRTICIFFVAVGIIIAGMWLARIVPALFTQTAPFGLEHYATLVIQALDLGFIVPACFVAAYLLHKRNPWGYQLSAVLLIKAVTMTAAVSAMAISMCIAGVSMPTGEIFVFPTFAIGSAFLLWKALSAIKDTQ